MSSSKGCDKFPYDNFFNIISPNSINSIIVILIIINSLTVKKSSDKALITATPMVTKRYVISSV